ncbi:hypothetical protein ACFFRR_007737 [Megaselia abdita]
MGLLCVLLLWVHLIKLYGGLDLACSNDKYSALESESRQLKKFHLLRRCQRSTKQIVEYAHVENLGECKRLARNRKGLAINYAWETQTANLFTVNVKAENGTSFPRKANRKDISDQPEQFFNCLVFDCPETVNMTAMVNDSRFDYYSLYTNPPPSKTSICLPKVGIFEMMRKYLNYTESMETCRKNFSGSLAHVASLRRTQSIGDLIENKEIEGYSEFQNWTYIGLNSSVQSFGEFQNVEGENLKCFLFRAWEPNYPKEEWDETCVAISRQRSWVTVDCKRKLPSVCEIHTSSPANAVYFKNFCGYLDIQ